MAESELRYWRMVDERKRRYEKKRKEKE